LSVQEVVDLMLSHISEKAERIDYNAIYSYQS
jgi:hypothetical protein